MPDTVIVFNRSVLIENKVANETDDGKKALNMSIRFDGVEVNAPLLVKNDIQYATYTDLRKYYDTMEPEYIDDGNFTAGLLRTNPCLDPDSNTLPCKLTNVALDGYALENNVEYSALFVLSAMGKLF